MKKLSLRQVEFIGAIFVSLAGSLDHFLYEWSKWTWVGIFSPINESPWEHLKIYAFPILIFLMIEWFIVEKKRELLFAKLVQIISGMIFIVVFFYTYTGALGFENVFVDILSFFVASFVGYHLCFRILESGYKPKYSKYIYASGILLVVAYLSFVTFYPPHLPLFMDKNTKSYGISENIYNE